MSNCPDKGGPAKNIPLTGSSQVSKYFYLGLTSF